MKISYRKKAAIARLFGFSISDGLTFTVGGGYLTHGERNSLCRANGWPVEDTALEIINASGLTPAHTAKEIALAARNSLRGD